MTKHTTRLAGCAALLLSLAAAASARVKLNDIVTVNGWSTASSYQYIKASPGTYTDSFNVDAALLGATVTPAKGLTGTFSLYHRSSGEGSVGSGGSEVTVLDAYFSYASTP